MEYLKSVRDLVEGKTRSGNALEHELHEIVSEARATGCSRRDVLILRNGFFRHSEDMHGELERFCAEFDLVLSKSKDGRAYEFWRK